MPADGAPHLLSGGLRRAHADLAKLVQHQPAALPMFDQLDRELRAAEAMIAELEKRDAAAGRSFEPMIRNRPWLARERRHDAESTSLHA